MTMDAIDSESARSSEAVQTEPDYPTPPDLNVAAWSILIGTAAVSAPHLLGRLEAPGWFPSSALDEAKHGSAQRAVGGSSPTPSDFYRRAFWAPDGSVILAVTESQQKHVLRCGDHGSIKCATRLKSPSPLLDAIWYPMPALESPSTNPELPDAAAPLTLQATPTATWCFAESHRDLPIRLTASNDGQARASYSIMNHVEKYVGPHSLAFSPDLSRLYCGLYSTLAVFPLSRPGLNTHAHIPLIPGKRSAGGQKGILSALATTTHPGDPTHELVAIGTYNATVGIYSFDPATFPEPAEHTATHSGSFGEETLAQSSCLAGWREIEGDGITQLKFHPLMPYVLFVASRRSDYIYVYDTRYLMGGTSRWSFRPLAQAAAGVRAAHLLAKLRRPGGTSHQRLHFDVDWAGRWLASGDEHGSIHLWRIDTGRFTDQDDSGVDGRDAADSLELAPDLSWKAHEDAVGSVSFHPYEPWLASVSGSRRWPDTGSASESDSEAEESGSSASSDASASAESASRRQTWTTNDSSFKIWDFSRPPPVVPS